MKKWIVVLSAPVVVSTMLICSCASQPTVEPYQSRIYIGSYEEVWTATLRALNDYPLKITNKDTGKIQTEVVNGPYNDLVFSYPEPLELPERFRYSVKFNIAKLPSEAGTRSAVRLRITKDLERFQDFYTGWLAYPSDGLEEKVLLYRIQHVLQMNKRLIPQVSDEG